MKLVRATWWLCICLGAFPVSAQIPPNFKGDFQSELRFDGGQGAVAVAIGDVNGDGRADLVVADYTGNSVSVLLGNGDGTFSGPTSYAAGNYPYAVALADVNGDGHPDIVCANLNLNHLTLGGVVSVLLGKGDGTFAPAVNYVAGNNLSSVVLADFNADGHIDIATADVASGNVAILLNNGDGTFQSAVQYAAGPNPFSLGTVDFNGDGHADLAVTNLCDVSQDNFNCGSFQTTVTVLLGHGDGTFGPPAAYKAGSAPFNLIVQDFNSDGKSDIAVSNFRAAPSNIAILLGNGDGTFQPPVNYPAGSYSTGIATSDFNNDGTLDLIGASSNGFMELLGVGTGMFDAGVAYFAQLSLGNIAVGDLNGDGRPDVVVMDQTSVGVFLNANGTNRQATSIAAASSQNPVQALAGPTITASVTPSASTLEGSVTFYVDGQAVISGGNLSPPLGQLNSSGQATCCLNYIAAGTHAIVAIYSGDTTTAGSTSNTLTQTITAIPTGTVLSSTPNPSLSGQTVTFTATVSGMAVTGPSDGSVTFLDGSNALGTVPVVFTGHGNNSSATLNVSNLTVGTHSITAAYENSAYFAPSVSAALQQGVNGNLNLGIASGAQSSAKVSAGQTAQYSLAIGGAGFSGLTSLSCTGAPTGATCSVMPPSLMVSATTPSQLRVNVTTTSRSSALLQRQRVFAPWIWAVVVIGFLGLPRRVSGASPKTRLFSTLLCFIGLLSSSCGGNDPSSNVSGTPAGTYTITVVATSGSVTDSLPLTLTVQ